MPTNTAPATRPLVGGIVLYAIALALAMGFFLLTLGLANQQSVALMAERFGAGHGARLEFIDCEVALSLLAEQAEDPGTLFVPNTVAWLDGQDPCAALERYHENPRTAAIERVRPRYWWGGRALYALLLPRFTLAESKTIVFAVTCISLLALLILLSRTDARTFVATLPLVVFAAFLSGRSTGNEIPLAAGFLWAVLAAGALCAIARSARLAPLLHPYAFFAGLVSAFVWLLDGHLLLLVPTMMVIAYFCGLGASSPRRQLVRAVTVVAVFHLGFALCHLVGFALRGSFFDWSTTLDSVARGIGHRAGSIAGGVEITSIDVLRKLIFVGFQNSALAGQVLAWKALLVGSALAGGLGAAHLLLRARSAPGAAYHLLVLVAAAAYFLARVLALPNHSFVHANMLGSYVFVLCALGWSAFLIACHEQWKGALDTPRQGTRRPGA